MSNIYIYDSHLGTKRHQKALEKLETRLTDLGLSGKIYRLAPMTRVEEIIRDETKKGPKTIVTVGGDGLFTRVAGLLLEKQIPLAIIPIGTESVCAAVLGVTSENACKVLAARRLLTLDVGKTNTGAFFLSQLVVTTSNPVLKIDNEITARADGSTTVQITNLLPDDFGYGGIKASPEDGQLNMYILKTGGNFLKKDVSQSSIACRHVEFTSGPYSAEIDGGVQVMGVQEVTILPKALSVIASKERKF